MNTAEVKTSGVRRSNLKRLRAAISVLDGYRCDGTGLTEAELVDVRYQLWKGVERLRTATEGGPCEN